MPIEKVALQKILIVCTIVLLVTNILLTMKFTQSLERLKSCQNPQESLPCQAVPVSFVMDEPECTDKLLRAMNVSNVHILSAESLDSLISKATFRSQYLSRED